MDCAVPGSGGADVTKMTPPPPVPVPVLLPVAVLAAATWAGEASFGLATTVSVRAAAVIAISCSRSVSSRAMVWLPGTASMASAALKAPDPGAKTTAPTATAITATAAITEAGETMPKRRNTPRLRRLLRVPVRCCDKAIPSFSRARWRPECQKYPPAAQHLDEKPGGRLTALAVTVVTANWHFL